MEKLLRAAFTTYIRPVLEYAATVINPTQKYLISVIEKIQRSFTKRIPTLSHLSYLDRLKSRNLELLETRRLHFELIFYYKIINNLTPLSPFSLFQFYYPSPSRVRAQLFSAVSDTQYEEDYKGRQFLYKEIGPTYAD